MAPTKRYWLLKSEPSAYSIDDLERDGSTSWEGVRNYQARNFLRDDVKLGDAVLFYASSTEPAGVAGLARVSRAGYPDHFAFDREHEYFDEKSDPASPTWYMIDVELVERFPEIVTISELRRTPGLERMMVLLRGSRLSVQPVTKEEFEIVARLGRRKVRR